MEQTQESHCDPGACRNASWEPQELQCHSPARLCLAWSHCWCLGRTEHCCSECTSTSHTCTECIAAACKRRQRHQDQEGNHTCCIQGKDSQIKTVLHSALLRCHHNCRKTATVEVLRRPLIQLQHAQALMHQVVRSGSKGKLECQWQGRNSDRSR